jgi:diguanylate cyclase (GGDEF)-like protein
VVSATTDSRRAPTVAPRASRKIFALFGFLGAILAIYIVSRIIRPADQNSELIDGWSVAAFEGVAGFLCMARVLGRRRGWGIPLALGAAAVSWATGDLVLTILSRGGATVSSPSIVDVFWLGFYPLAYLGIVLLIRREVKHVLISTWLDGAVAGLGAAAVCATFAFDTILNSVGGDPLSVATNLAYPVGDVLLVALVVGGTAILPNRKRLQWVLLGGACSVNAIGDTFALFQTSSKVGTVFNAVAWPTALLLIALSVWLRPAYADPLAEQRAPGFLLPGLGALAALTILVVDSVHHVGQAASGLATATLIVVGIRLTLSVRRLRAITEERHRQAITDDLTGLGNRRRLFQLLAAFFADQADTETPRRHLAFLFVDLNHFKEINDAFGHAAGDKLLKQLGPRLTGALRGSDVLVRIGGDELGVVLMDTDHEYATIVAERLKAKLEEPFILNSVSVRISASIGIALAPADASDSTELLRCADLAMYRAKAGPASSFIVYERQIDDAGGRLRLVEELREAVESGEFILHYQPQIDLQTGEISAVEALLRWPHPRLGLIPPLDFLPLAEEAGLMPSLTEMVLDRALAQCAAWRAGGRQLAVSVNISPSNLLDPEFCVLVPDLLARHGLPASALILEITETTIVADFDGCKRVIAQLRDLGVVVSIDDFGAGFTSLAYLGSLAVGELKLDRTFITRLTAQAGDRELTMVQAMIDLGHALGLRVVAEGIEDAATFDTLERLGCDVVQGFFISRPKPAEDVAFAPDFGSAPRPVTGLRAS